MESYNEPEEISQLNFNITDKIILLMPESLFNLSDNDKLIYFMANKLNLTVNDILWFEEGKFIKIKLQNKINRNKYKIFNIVTENNNFIITKYGI